MSLPWFSKTLNMLKVPRWIYSGGSPVALLDPATGLPATGMPTYSTTALLEAAYPAASNTYLTGIVTGVHDSGVTGGSHWKSNGAVYMPLGAPIYTQAAAEAAFSSASYTGMHITFSDVGNAEHVYDGTNWVPVNGRCLVSKTATQVKFIAPVTGSDGVVASVGNNGGFMQFTFTGAHLLTTSPAVGANLINKTTANGWTLGQRLTIKSIDGANTLTVNVAYSASYGVPAIMRVGEEGVVEAIALPKLHGYSGIDLNATFGCAPGTTTKILLIRLNSTSSNLLTSTGVTTTSIAIEVGFRNQNGSVSSQLGKSSLGVIGTGTGNTPVSLSVNTGVATTLYIATNFQTTVNEIFSLERWELWKIG